MQYNIFNIFPSNISKHQAKDTGMAIVLILLLLGFFLNDSLYFKLSVIFLLVNMIYPLIYKPMAIIWLGFSFLLGTVVSKILLSLVFFIVVLPVALIRRLMGIDSLKIQKFKKSSQSVFENRDITYSGKDIENPF
jgi:hypothetical protein